MKGAWGIMCCGCRRVLGKDGMPLETKSPFVIEHQATFHDRESAETEARRLGWATDNGNHRCPNCFTRSGFDGARGGFVAISE